MPRVTSNSKNHSKNINANNAKVPGPLRQGNSDRQGLSFTAGFPLPNPFPAAQPARFFSGSRNFLLSSCGEFRRTTFPMQPDPRAFFSCSTKFAAPLFFDTATRDRVALSAPPFFPVPTRAHLFTRPFPSSGNHRQEMESVRLLAPSGHSSPPLSASLALRFCPSVRRSPLIGADGRTKPHTLLFKSLIRR